MNTLATQTHLQINGKVCCYFPDYVQSLALSSLKQKVLFLKDTLKPKKCFAQKNLKMKLFLSLPLPDAYNWLTDWYTYDQWFPDEKCLWLVTVGWKGPVVTY